MPNATPKVNYVRENSTISADGKTSSMLQINFTVGKHGPFNISMPQEGWTAAKAEEQMNAFAQQLNQLPQE